MDREKVQELLVELRDIILLEREHARELDLQAMSRDVEQKEALIQVLNTVGQLHPDDRKYALDIQHENRRNAYLFKATLNWIQDTMVFFGRKTVPATYGQTGSTTSAPIHGRLLSGRI